MRIAIISFTRTGAGLGERCRELLLAEGQEAQTYCQEKWGQEFIHSRAHTKKAGEWAREQWPQNDALIFIGASGIAVRSIAPLVQHKTVDPAVLVIDEKGQFVISLLSGHLGGANALASRLAKLLGGQAVITTATDVQGRFAVDVWAKKNGLFISSLRLARDISAAVLAGEAVGFSCDYPVDGCLPPELGGGSEAACQLVVGIDARRDGLFVPDSCILGIGCRRGKSQEELARAVDETLAAFHIHPRAISRAATIDLKKDEEGLLALCRERGWPLITFSAQELMEAAGDFTPSEFVRGITGVDNVCERAAICAGGRTFRIRKQARDGVTIALAEMDRRISFE